MPTGSESTRKPGECEVRSVVAELHIFSGATGGSESESYCLVSAQAL
jgi:hypothetical protein